jgi:uncharacterized protein (TIGR02453 family)
MPRSTPQQSPFAGFHRDAFGFFRALGLVQSREWVAEHRDDYERAVRAPMLALLTEVSSQLSRAGVPLSADPKRALFRLNRDVRFSADKRPFNTHTGAALTRDGARQSPGALYFHLEPGGCFVGAGFHRAEPPQLLQLRRALVARPAAWKAVEAGLDAASLPLQREDALVRLPRGFEDAPPDIAEALKLKSWVVTRPLTATEVGKASLVDLVVKVGLAAAPLLQFGWDALDEAPALPPPKPRGK